VHFVAGLRYLLQATGQEVVGLFAYTSLLQEKLIPADTVNAVIKISNGNNGTFTASFGTEYKAGLELEVVTDRGCVQLAPSEVVFVRKNSETGETEKDTTSFEYSSGVKEEMASFAAGIRDGKIDPRQSPEEAYADLEILQAMLESGLSSSSIAISGTHTLLDRK
jgi:predicted dehydrogenase